ncbi:MAG: DHH family phosphoesterase [Sedimenticola sp.]|nr:DHH family phosphoesterase [Sedimenticola sp.]
MAIFDVFNGDADGICALLQLRLNEPLESELVTGVKRDVQLLKRVQAGVGDRVTVLDISLQTNRDDLVRLLSEGAHVFYVDHHMPGEIPDHSALQTIIDTDPEICTSLLIDRHLEGCYRAWALTAAFGDNLVETAFSLGQASGFSSDQLEQMRLLGTCINYNGYGETVEDLHIPPMQLYQFLLEYRNPLDFVADRGSCFEGLKQGYQEDLDRAGRVKPDFETDSVAVYLLPDQPWSRRVSGIFGNHLANLEPDRAHAVLTLNRQNGYQVSVRAPLSNRRDADLLCSRFPSGGGRKGAAGINHLPMEIYPDFVDEMKKTYG